MVAVLEGSPVPRSICFTSASFGGARMLGFLARISSYFQVDFSYYGRYLFSSAGCLYLCCDLDCLYIVVEGPLQVASEGEDPIRP
jgi:hypothetical protein